MQRHNITTLAVGSAFIAGALLAFYLERLLSRKALLTSSWIGQGLALMCVSLASGAGKGGGALAVGCTLAAAAFGVGAGPPTLLSKQELNPAYIKGAGCVRAGLLAANVCFRVLLTCLPAGSWSQGPQQQPQPWRTGCICCWRRCCSHCCWSCKGRHAHLGWQLWRPCCAACIHGVLCPVLACSAFVAPRDEYAAAGSCTSSRHFACISKGSTKIV